MESEISTFIKVLKTLIPKPTLHRLHDAKSRGVTFMGSCAGLGPEQSLRSLKGVKRQVERGLKATKSAPRVLFVSSNGAGLGHLTRLNSIARIFDHNEDAPETYFYSLSRAVGKLNREQTRVTYFSSYGQLKIDSRQWNSALLAHFGAVLSTLAPTLVVFDGTFVYPGIARACQGLGVPLVWLQRGCWKLDVASDSFQLKHPEKVCDFVIIPGDYALDENLAINSVPVRKTAPIVQEDTGLLSRFDARTVLKLPLHEKLVLLQLGAGRINNIAEIRNDIVQTIQKLPGNYKVVIPSNPLAAPVEKLENVIEVEAYPISAYLSAFDFIVCAGGYNSVQESIAARVPSLIIPNLDTSTDDQLRRAYGAESKGYCFAATESTEIRNKLKLLVDPSVQAKLRSNMAETEFAQGAKQAAQILSKWIDLLEASQSDSVRRFRCV